MEVTVTEQGPRTVLKPIGSLDTNTSPILEECANNLFDQGIYQMLVDMNECDYVSSAGLRVIVAMQKNVTSNEGSLAFSNVKSDVMDVFEMTGFSNILTFE